MLIGGGTLAIGIAAVFAAILYKIATYDSTGRTPTAGAAAPTLSLAALGLPADAKLVSTALDGNSLALTYQTSSGTETLLVETPTGIVLGRVKIGP